MSDIVLVIPNLDGGDALLEAVRSLVSQDPEPDVVVVDNASTDGSAERTQEAFPQVTVLFNSANLGYAGGVNTGIDWALKRDYRYVGVFNDDAVAQHGWVRELVAALDADQRVAAATGKVLDEAGVIFDSAGDCITTWGLAIPRGRGQVDNGQFDKAQEIFAASGAATIYRAAALRQVGMFDEDFFAYFEDVDLSFRLRLVGWRIVYRPNARVHHLMGMTSSRSRGFVTFQTMKNMPVLLFKNVPLAILVTMLPRFVLAQASLTLWALRAGQGRSALRGHAAGMRLAWQKRHERASIRRARSVDVGDIKKFLVTDLPSNRRDLVLYRDLWNRALTPVARWRNQ